MLSITVKIKTENIANYCENYCEILSITVEIKTENIANYCEILLITMKYC